MQLQTYQMQEMPALFTPHTHQECQDIARTPNEQQLLIQTRKVQTDDRIALLVMVVVCVIAALWGFTHWYLPFM